MSFECFFVKILNKSKEEQESFNETAKSKAFFSSVFVILGVIRICLTLALSPFLSKTSNI